MGASGFIEAHLGSRDVARVIYGAIIGLAFVVALEVHPPGAAEAAAGLVGTALAVGLAELYSEAIAGEARTHERIDRAELRRLLGEAAAGAVRAGVPAPLFGAAAARGLGLR